MQKARTLQFWDDFYTKEEERKVDVKEWIIRPTDSILKLIESYLHDKDEDNDPCTPTNVLEIGCGNSKFAFELWKYLNHKVIMKDRSVASEQQSMQCITNVLATDVSPICIMQNQKRDSKQIQDVLSSLECLTESVDMGCFEYDVLNVLDTNNQNHDGKYSLILDKGCLDTFLFRSSGQNKGGEHSPMLRTLFNNVYKWLRKNGKYIIITPRSKLKSIRDFTGFSSVQRVSIFDVPEKSPVIADLDGNSGKNKCMFMYICIKNDDYEIDISPAFCGNFFSPQSSDCCSSCGLRFSDFLVKQPENRRRRIWNGHKTHCRSKSTKFYKT